MKGAIKARLGFSALVLSTGAWLASASLAAAPAARQMPARVGPIAVVGANQSSNWSGYNQGTLEDGNEQYTSIAGTWVVPKASQHTRGEDEYSSTWVGIGGGCVDASCQVTDETLIQAGTEQDVSASGQASYYAWWEIIPEPETQISLLVHPGNTITVSITQTSPGMWQIVIRNVSTRRSATIDTPYSSSYATAEWIEETPLVIGTNGGFAPLPNLTTVHFDHALTDGVNPQLIAGEQMQLVDSGGSVIAQPSNPDSDTDGFNDCAWHTTCGRPSS